jgi:hypothetical protein
VGVSALVARVLLPSAPAECVRELR